MRLWVYLKSSGQLQYIITSQREGEGEEKEEKEGGGQERHGLSPKNRLPEDGRGCSQVKDAPHGEGKRKGGTCKRGASTGGVH